MLVATRDSVVTTGPLLRLFALVVIISLVLVPSGCGGGGESGAENGDSAGSAELAAQVDELYLKAMSLVENAKKAEAEKYAATDLDSAIRGLAKAKEYMDEGESKKAKRQITSSKRKLDLIIRNIAKVSSEMKGILEKIATYNTKLAEAKAAGADKYAASEVEGAARSFEKAQGYIEDGKAKSAGKYIGYAIGDLNRALEEVGRKNQHKTNADEEKSLLAEKRQQALDAGAEEKALRDLEYARDRERLGDQAYERGEFEMASRNYRDAKSGYVGAIETAQRVTNAAAVTAGNHNPGIPDLPTGDGDEVPGIDQIDIPDIGAGGDADIATDLPGLFAGAAEYNSAKSSLRINWADGTELQRDMKRLLGDPAHVHFEGDEGVGQGQDGAYVMAANTSGYWVVNASFEDGVRVRAKVLFQLLINKPDFEILLMSNQGQDFYAVSYGATARVYDDGLSVGHMKSPLPAYKKNPKDWVQKREAYDFEFVYYKRGDDKGVLEAKINGETTLKLKTDRYRKGFPGFRWNDTKFIIQELEISGLVDEEWAKAEVEKAASGHREGEGEDEIDF
ncbi:MAG: hypothetical protein VX404_02340 [Planctomycetota bacterium]|nr:hypothetical protein [Planctomycetota bacterium]